MNKGRTETGTLVLTKTQHTWVGERAPAPSLDLALLGLPGPLPNQSLP